MTPDLTNQLLILLPEIFLALTAMGLLLIGVYSGNRSTGLVLGGAMVLLTAALFMLYRDRDLIVEHGTFIHDYFAFFGKWFILAGTVLSLALTHAWLREEENRRFEFPILILLCTVGMMLMVGAGDLLIVYLGLELASLTQYVLAAFSRDRVRSTESGLKYFVLGSLASGMLLFGISLVYGYAGSIEFAEIAARLSQMQIPQPGVETAMPVPYGLTLGMILILVGFCFKISAAPFHMWTPDVYEGAPTPVTAFFSVAPKIAGIMLLLRLLAEPFASLAPYWQQIVIAVAVLSMLVGSFGALRQQNLKRLLAYSSIGHVGYALMGVAAVTTDGYASLLIYMALYVFMSIGAFGCLMMMRRGGMYVETIQDLSGVSKTHPWFAFAMAVFMFSMAGIPPLAGFFAKLYVFLAAVQAGLVWLAVLGLLTSVVGAYYYIRIVKLMYFDESAPRFEFPESLGLRLSVGLCTFVMLFFIARPSLLAGPAQAAARALIP